MIIIIIIIIITKRFTALEQGVVCAPVMQWTRVRFPVGTSFLSEVSLGVFTDL